MRLTLLTAIGLAIVTNLIPGWKPRLDIDKAERGETPPQPLAEAQPAESPSAK